MYFVYVLLSERDNRFYTGYTNCIEERMERHNKGFVSSTKSRRPLKLIYYEGCLNQQDAPQREKYLKSGRGKIYIKTRLSEFLSETRPSFNSN
jgi:putative endonuclease